MKNIDSYNHVRGESMYVDDITMLNDTLHCAILGSPVARGKIAKLDLTKALDLPDVVSIFTYKDIPGANQIGAIIPDETLLAEDEVHYVGQPIAIIVGKTEKIARQAKEHINIEVIEEKPVTLAKDAKEKNLLIAPPRTFRLGDIDSAWKDCEYIYEGQVKSGAQEHLYLETQGSYVFPQENGCLKVISSTQGPTVVQKIGARVLGIPMHKIEVDVKRLGGAFGGKEDQATPWAVMAMLASYLLNKPVKLILSRHDDIYMTGKRHPYHTNYKIGLSKNLKIIAFKAEYLQNAGAAADLSPAITERTLFHATNSYFIPNVEATVYSCKTNLPPNTAFRGFGAPQAIFVIESAITDAAVNLGMPVRKLQKINLLNNGDVFPYGQIASGVHLSEIWKTANESFNFGMIEKSVNDFNNQSTTFKKGISFTPVTFGISFTNTIMNHARALVHIYQDGSVGISTGAVEMGQSVNTKMIQVASRVLSVRPDRIKIESTNTTRVANTSPSAASSTADLNGKAVEKACMELLNRLLFVASEILSVSVSRIKLIEEIVVVDGNYTEMRWGELIIAAFERRVSLTESGHYATPKIKFDKITEKGHPFAYHVYGLAITNVTIDCIRGIYNIDSVKIVHDFGKSINLDIDIGQIEGGLLQGIGWVTMEEIKYSEDGHLLSNALSTYKIPDIFSAPDNIKIIPLKTKGEENALLKSKAVGEPPFIYGIGTFFAIQNAIAAANENYSYCFDAPMTPEKLLMALYNKSDSI